MAKQSLLQYYQDRLIDQVNQALVGVTLFNWLQAQNQKTQTIRPQAHLDYIYDQTLHVNYDLITPKDQDQFKLLNYIEQAITVDLDPSPLNPEQQKLYDIVIVQYIQELAYNDLLQLLLLNIDSVTGSKKTFTLLKTCTRLQELAERSRKGNPIVYVALIGVIAFNIVRQTLYSLFQLPIK